MLNLPKGYKGKLIKAFAADKKYGPECFFASEGVHLCKSPLGDYLETSDEPLSRFGYRFKIDNKDKPHMLVLAYPDDKRRHMMINDCFSYDLSCGVFTDDEYPITNTVKKIYKVFHTRTEDLTLTVMSWGKNEPAAIMGFAVYELECLDEFSFNKPKSVKCRRYGVQYEDPCGVFSDLGAQNLNEWTDKYIEFAKHTGLNAIVQPINWYAGPTYDSVVQPPSASYWLSLENRDQYTVASVAPCDWVTPFLDKCEKAEIDFIGGMTLLRLGNLLKNMNVDLPSIIAGKDTYNNMRADNKVQSSTNDWTRIYSVYNYKKMIEEGRESFDIKDFDFAFGEKADSFGGAPMFNPLHPEVERQLVEYFEEISMRFGCKKAFKGISLNIWHSSIIWFSSIFIGYDDYTIKLFESECGIKIPVDIDNDPERFSKRFNYIIRRCREAFINWRCKKIRELILKLRDALRKYNSKLSLFICAWNEPVKRTMYRTLDESMQYPAFMSENDFLREGGLDFSLFKQDDGISFSVEQNQHRDRGWTTDGSELPIEQKRFFHDMCYLDSSWIKAENSAKTNGAFVFDSWTEGWGDHRQYPFNVHSPEIDRAIEKTGMKDAVFFRETCRLESGGFWFDSQRQITSCYPTDTNYMEPLAHAVALLDPMYLMRGGLYLDCSHVSEMRSYAAAFTALPEVKFDTVKGKNDPVTVREKNVETNHYFYAVNREPYDVRVTLRFTSEACYREICSEKNTAQKTDTISFTLPAFSMKSFVCDGENTVIGYSTEIAPKEIEKLTEQYNAVMKAFAIAKKKGLSVFGLEETEEKIKAAYADLSPAQLRHLMNSYVSLKVKDISTKNKLCKLF